MPSNQIQNAICCIGVGQWYGRGVDRLVKSLDEVGYTGQRIIFKDSYPDGCPKHSDDPYAFKLWAMQRARDQGATRVLWVDASAWAIRNPDPIFDLISDRGAFVMMDGHFIGEWTSDQCLANLGIDRESVMRMGMIWACSIGLDFARIQCQEFFRDWQSQASIGSFRGPWNNDDRKASPDPRVRGHRHDQSVASVLVHRYGLPFTPCGDALFRSAGNDDGTVCFWAQGL